MGYLPPKNMPYNDINDSVDLLQYQHCQEDGQPVRSFLFFENDLNLAMQECEVIFCRTLMPLISFSLTVLFAHCIYLVPVHGSRFFSELCND